MANTIRKDKNRIVLKKGESERKNGTYCYRWTDDNKNRHTVYAKSLKELREKEKEISKSMLIGITFNNSVTLRDMIEILLATKVNLKISTQCVYDTAFGIIKASKLANKKIQSIKKTEVKKYYIYLIEDKGLTLSTIKIINAIVNQAFQLAIDDNYIQKNPCTNILKDFSTNYTTKKNIHALTKQEEQKFFEYLYNTPKFSRYVPVFVILANTGMRIGELLGLTWDDIDFLNETISINKTLVYKKIENHHKFYLNAPKTKTSIRKIPLLPKTKEAFQREKDFQKVYSNKPSPIINNISNFIFTTKSGRPFVNNQINRKLKQIIIQYNSTHYNDKLPMVSLHCFRHTFATRLCENNVNIKVIQKLLGHSNIATTMDIYAEATDEFSMETYKKLKDIL